MIFTNFLKALPEIIRLILILMKQSHDREVKGNIKLIGEAFEKRDAEAIRALFNHSPVRDIPDADGVRDGESDSKAGS